MNQWATVGPFLLWIPISLLNLQRWPEEVVWVVVFYDKKHDKKSKVNTKGEEGSRGWASQMASMDVNPSELQDIIEGQRNHKRAQSMRGHKQLDTI